MNKIITAAKVKTEMNDKASQIAEILNRNDDVTLKRKTNGEIAIYSNSSQRIR